MNHTDYGICCCPTCIAASKNVIKNNSVTRWGVVFIVALLPYLILFSFGIQGEPIPWNTIGPPIIIAACLGLTLCCVLGGGWKEYEKRCIKLQEQVAHLLTSDSKRDTNLVEKNMAIAKNEAWRNMIKEQLQAMLTSIIEQETGRPVSIEAGELFDIGQVEPVDKGELLR